MLKLSIITINYNNAAGLLRTIESVVGQTATNFEYIVIDGGSTDGSIEVIRQYADNITLWVSEPDRGIYQAMNKGILLATGDYCQFLNSGDWLVNRQVVEKMLNFAPTSSILIGNLLTLDANGVTQKDTMRHQKISFLTFYRGTLNHSSAYIKRSLFETYGLYDESLKIVADWKFYLQVVGLHGESVACEDVDVSYFDMSGISNQQRKLHIEERRKVLKECLPENILKDYDRHWFDIEQMNRLKRYGAVKHLLYYFERFIYKLEKFKIINLANKQLINSLEDNNKFR